MAHRIDPLRKHNVLLKAFVALDPVAAQFFEVFNID